MQHEQNLITWALVNGMTGGRKDHAFVSVSEIMDGLNVYALGTSFTVNLN